MFIETNRSVKLSKVGFFAKNVGGKRNNSSIGFKDWFIANTSGATMIRDITARKI